MRFWRGTAETASLEDRHPASGDSHADPHDQVEDEKLDSDARQVTQVALREELRPPTPSEAEEEHACADDDEAFDQDDEQLRGDDGERDDDDERADASNEAGKEAIQQT